MRGYAKRGICRRRVSVCLCVCVSVCLTLIETMHLSCTVFE